MDDAAHPPGNDSDGYFGALDFGDERAHDSSAAPDFADEYGHDRGAVLDFGDEYADDGSQQSVIEVLDTEEPAEPADTGTQDAIRALSEDSVTIEDTSDKDDESSRKLATVTNPAETVSVTAIITGEIQRIELSPTVVRTMTAAELADEIRVIANLARQQAQAKQYALLLESVHATGASDDEAVGEMLENHLGLSSPRQAAAAQAEVFATRYASDSD